MHPRAFGTYSSLLILSFPLADETTTTLVTFASGCPLVVDSQNCAGAPIFIQESGRTTVKQPLSYLGWRRIHHRIAAAIVDVDVVAVIPLYVCYVDVTKHPGNATTQHDPRPPPCLFKPGIYRPYAPGKAPAPERCR